MRRYRQFVAVASPHETRDSVGGTIVTWEVVDGMSRVPATIISVKTDEKIALGNPEAEVFRMVLAGHHPEIQTEWAILDGQAVYDVRSITLTLGRKATIIIAERVAL